MASASKSMAPVCAFCVDGDVPEDIRLIVSTRIEERCSARKLDSPAAFAIVLQLRPDAGAQAFEISDQPGGVRISGIGLPGLVAGIGKFLRTSQFLAEGFVPSAWRGSSAPAGQMRCIYFATHFFNFYHVAPDAEIARYLEDLALWGYNHLLIAFPILNLTGWDDPKTDGFFARARLYHDLCRRLGLGFGIFVPPNQDFQLARPEFTATPNRDPLGRKGNHGNNICINRPGALNYILELHREFIRRLQPMTLDLSGFGPYDEGGCGCDDCHPWGGRGFLKLSRRLAALLRDAFPGIKLILGTWMFDTPPAGEWEALARSIEREGNYVDFILADAHEDYPRYPLDVGVPGGLPLINFPEISMWGLFPWGGYGANPLPRRFQRLWDQVKHVVRGGYPYSEGIYEDINKTIVSQFYWLPSSTAAGTMKEYIRYEFPGASVDDVLSMIDGIETNHTQVALGQKPDRALAERVHATAQKVEGQLSDFARRSWRWRMLYLRTLLDRERYAALPADGMPKGKSWGDLLRGNAAAEGAFRELIAISHCRKHDDGQLGDHAWVRPPLKE